MIGTSSRLAIAFATPKRSPGTSPEPGSGKSSNADCASTVLISVRICTQDAPAGAASNAMPAARAASLSRVSAGSFIFMTIAVAPADAISSMIGMATAVAGTPTPRTMSPAVTSGGSMASWTTTALTGTSSPRGAAATEST